MYLLRLSQTLILSIRLLTLSKENGRWDSASLMSPSRFPPSPPPPQLQYLMAHSQYSRQNNWNSVSQNHSLIILSTRQEKEGKKRKKEKKKSKALHQWKLFPLTDSFGGQISSSSFSLDEGMESCLISSSLWIGHWGGGGGESEIESEEGRNNLQVIVSAIILPKNKFLIIVICCFADKKAISVYFLISPHLLCHNAKYSCNISYNGNKKLLRGNCV